MSIWNKNLLLILTCFFHFFLSIRSVFNQGDIGSWWYVIFRGSVTVDIAGKGTVCTLKEGEEFGKLALVNNAPRAATIITAEDNTQFFKVPKEDFNRILVDVEANTIRLKEHGQDVLILLRLAVKGTTSPGESSSRRGAETPSSSSGIASSSSSLSSKETTSKLTVIAGTPEKMIEYCLESRFDSSWSPAEYQYNNYFYSHSFNNNSQHETPRTQRNPGSSTSGPTSLYSAHLDLLSKDTFFEDFILTFMVFMSSSSLCHHLFRHYKVEDFASPEASRPDDTDFFVRSKRRVIRFVYSWRSISGEHFLSDANVVAFVSTLESCAKEDNFQEMSRFHNKLNAELDMIQMLSREIENYEQDYASKGVKKWKSDLPGVLQIMTINGTTSSSSSGTSLSNSQYSPSRQLPSINLSSRTLPSVSSTTGGFAAASSTMFQAAAAVPGLSHTPVSVGNNPFAGHQNTPPNESCMSSMQMQTPSALLSSAYTSTNLGSVFVGTPSGLSSPVASSSGLLPFSVPIPASAAVAEYTSDPYFQEPIRPKDESKFNWLFWQDSQKTISLDVRFFEAWVTLFERTSE